MHEFSLATNIIEIVEDSVTKAAKGRVTSITLQIGELTGVENTALITALESLMNTEMLEGAKIVLKAISGCALCLECQTEYHLKNVFNVCPKCKSYMKEILHGKEFTVLSIDAE